MPMIRIAVEFVEKASRALAWLPPTLARLAVGWVFAVTGWGKLQNLEPVVKFFADLGIPYPELQAPFVACTELVCGTAILVGLLTRAAAVPLTVTMFVAIATAQWPQVESASDLLGLVETLYVVLFVWLAVAGPGPLSLDALGWRLLANRKGVQHGGDMAGSPGMVAARGPL